MRLKQDGHDKVHVVGPPGISQGTSAASTGLQRWSQMTSAVAAGTLAAVTSLQHFISWQHPKVLACDTDPAICKEAYKVWLYGRVIT